MGQVSNSVFTKGPNGSWEWHIRGEARLPLGGQLHNSASSDPLAVRAGMQRIKELGGDLVIGAVNWDFLEPREGEYDFRQVDDQLSAAREYDLDLVLIFFGAFKNAGSTYAPSWVRRDLDRFPRALIGETAPVGFERVDRPVLSLFDSDLLDVEARALGVLSRHIAESDSEGRVVLLQVDNEVGLLGDSRDRSVGAEKAWREPVPDRLIDALASGELANTELFALWEEQGRRTGVPWEDSFGPGPRVDETFMAWYFASHLEALASASKRALDVPHYANAWLGPQPGQEEAGQYPSGGPASRVLEVWRVAAPSIDLLAPDVYIDDVKGPLARYGNGEGPLFISESRFSAGSLAWAVGSGACGFSVFGIEDSRLNNQLSRLMRRVHEAQGIILAARRVSGVYPILLEPGETSSITIGHVVYTFSSAVDRLRSILLDAGVKIRSDLGQALEETETGLVPSFADTRALGVIVDVGDDEILVIGQGIMVDVEGRNGLRVEIDSVEEGRFVDGRWVRGRSLNGDERLEILPLDDIGTTRIRILEPKGGS